MTFSNHYIICFIIFDFAKKVCKCTNDRLQPKATLFFDLASKQNLKQTFDFSKRCSKDTLNEWAKYTTTSIAIKTIRDEKPVVQHISLKKTYYSEHCNIVRSLFFDASKT